MQRSSTKLLQLQSGGVFSAAAAMAAAGYVSRPVAAVGRAVKCWKDQLNISVCWISRSINWAALRGKTQLWPWSVIDGCCAPAPRVLGSRRSGSGLCRSILSSRKSTFLLEMTLFCPRRAALVMGSETRLAARTLQRGADVVLLLESWGNSFQLLQRWYASHSVSRPSLTGFRVVALGEENISRAKSLRASKKSKMHLLQDVS